MFLYMFHYFLLIFNFHFFVPLFIFEMPFPEGTMLQVRQGLGHQRKAHRAIITEIVVHGQEWPAIRPASAAAQRLVLNVDIGNSRRRNSEDMDESDSIRLDPLGDQHEAYGHQEFFFLVLRPEERRQAEITLDSDAPVRQILDAGLLLHRVPIMEQHELTPRRGNHFMDDELGSLRPGQMLLLTLRESVEDADATAGQLACLLETIERPNTGSTEGYLLQIVLSPEKVTFSAFQNVEDLARQTQELRPDHVHKKQNFK